MTYNWQIAGWPHLTYNEDPLREIIGGFDTCFLHLKDAIGRVTVAEAEVEPLVQEAVRTSALEGVTVDASVVTSSICRVLGVNYTESGFGLDRRAEGVSQLVLDVKRDWRQPLSTAMIRRWHLDLMREEGGLLVGDWRTHEDAMLVIRRNSYGESEVRFEAPPSSRVPEEMERFPSLVSGSEHVAVRAALAHLLFESIHPFVDGNGRIGRAIVQKLLAEGLEAPAVVPISVRIDKNRRAYYDALNAASQGLDATEWMAFFVPLLGGACEDFVAAMDFVRRKQAFLDHFECAISPRQAKAIKVCLKDGEEGVARGLSVAKYMRITGVSKATATRDLAELFALGAVNRIGQARATTYELNIGDRD